MNVHLSALGCRLNEAELQGWAKRFSRRGHRLVDDVERADLVVLNSCAVTGEAEKKTRQRIRRLHRLAPAARTVVSGCYASLGGEEKRQALQSDLGVDLVVPNVDKDDLVDIVEKELNFDAAPVALSQPEAVGGLRRGRSRAFLKVQDGCRHKCTYCIVTTARGDERSRPIAELIEDVDDWVDQGVKEVVLTGVHVGGYGSDLGVNLADLVEAILSTTKLPRLRFASVEPWDIDDRLFALFDNPRLMPHMHLPLQSGSDAILRRMGRRCRRQDFAELVDKCRQQRPDFNITTDIIVGFPGETDADFQASVCAVEDIGFGHVHIFPFSPRKGTRAAELDGHVADDVKRARCRQLADVAQRAKARFARSLIGTSCQVLVEKTDGGVALGYTPEFVRARVLLTDPSTDYRGRLIDVVVDDIDKTGDAVFGTATSLVTPLAYAAAEQAIAAGER